MWINTCQRIRQPLTARLSGLSFITNKRALLHVQCVKDELDPFTEYSVYPDVFWNDRHTRQEKITTSSSNQLVEKTVTDSLIERYLPFKSNPRFLDQYVFTNGKIRIEKLLEDVDKIVGGVGLKHTGNGDPGAIPCSVVTASFDRLELFLPNIGIKDIILSGRPSYVGSSSMEIFVKAETVPENGEPKQTVFSTKVSAIGVDPITIKPVKINPLKISTPEEQALFEEGLKNKEKRKLCKPLSDQQYLEEYQRLVDKFNLNGPTIRMEDTVFESSLLLQPQDRNRNGSVFGGFLIRLAYEQAQASTSLLMKSFPTFVSMDSAEFKRPAQVGSVLSLKSTIVMSEAHTVQVRVVAETTDIVTGIKEEANVFYFTVAADMGTYLPRVVPKTEEGRKLWVDAYRRHTLERNTVMEANK